MLRRALFSLRGSVSARCMASEGKGPKDPSNKDVIGQELLDAVNDVVKDLHGNNADASEKSKNSLLSKLISHEKATFSAATAAQTSEMLDDKALLNLLSDVAADNKKQPAPRSALLRQERRGMVLLRKEIFYQAKQDGFSATKAQQIAEKAVEEAKERVAKQREALLKGAEAEMSAEEKQVEDRTEKENKLYQYAYEMAEKMLYQDELAKVSGKLTTVIRADPNLGSLLNTTKKLGVFSTLEGTKEASLGFWDEWNTRAARIMNQSMGPENSFEEQIEWTKLGKQWEYPIDNEFKMGEEDNVSFIDHIFLERHLPALGIPKSGPIAHFMHLVCVGLSKNPYMPAAKKMEHLRWFANYFNEEQQKLVHRLHDEEQAAAAANA